MDKIVTYSVKRTKRDPAARHITKLQLLNKLSRAALQLDGLGYNASIHVYQPSYKIITVSIDASKWQADKLVYCDQMFIVLPTYTGAVNDMLDKFIQKIYDYESK